MSGSASFQILHRVWVDREKSGVLLKHPKNGPKPSIPFSDYELAKIMAAVEEFPDTPPGRRKHLRAFVLLLRYSGLRIQDAIRLTMDKITDGKLMLYTRRPANQSGFLCRISSSVN